MRVTLRQLKSIIREQVEKETWSPEKGGTGGVSDGEIKDMVAQAGFPGKNLPLYITQYVVAIRDGNIPKVEDIMGQIQNDPSGEIKEEDIEHIENTFKKPAYKRSMFKKSGADMGSPFDTNQAQELVAAFKRALKPVGKVKGFFNKIFEEEALQEHVRHAVRQGLRNR